MGRCGLGVLAVFALPRGVSLWWLPVVLVWRLSRWWRLRGRWRWLWAWGAGRWVLRGFVWGLFFVWVVSGGPGVVVAVGLAWVVLLVPGWGRLPR